MSFAYRGEYKILSGSVDSGLQFVRDDLDIAKKKTDQAVLVERAQGLMKQFGA